MKKETGIKYVVRVIYITKPLQKIHFTARHPEEALYLTGIAVTGTNFSRRGGDAIIFTDTTGIMSLAIPEKGDVFYTQEIKAETGNFSEYAEQRLRQSFINKSFSFSGKRSDYFNTCLPISDASIEGYYEDVSSARLAFLSLIRPEPIGIPLPRPDRKFYKVTLYLRYQMKEGKQT